ncbi:MAG: alpha/beta fold hydrolase [Rhodanobacteraceae bacterium]
MERGAASASGVSSHVGTADGLNLAVETRGPADAPPLLFAHGFGQGRRVWACVAAAIAAQGWRTIAFDARGHGDSDHASDGAYRLEQFVDDLVGVAAALEQPPVLVGHSMGGLLGLVAAGEVRPSPFRALVLVDISPRWEAPGVERIFEFMRAHKDGFASLEDASAAVGAYAPQRPRRRTLDELAALLSRGEDGRWHWQWDPALLDTIAIEADRHQARVLDAARKVEVPVLLVSGGRSDVVSEQSVAEFLRNVPNARHVEIADASHAVVGDDCHALTAAIASFLKTLAPTAPHVTPSRRDDRNPCMGIQP